MKRTEAEAARARAEVATPGPWEVRLHPTDDSEFHVAAATPKTHPYHTRCSRIEIMSDEEYPTKRNDAELIAAARTGLPAALDMLERAVELAKAVIRRKQVGPCVRLPGCTCFDCQALELLREWEAT